MTSLSDSAVSKPDSIAVLSSRYGRSYRSLAVTTLTTGVVATLLSGTSINVAIPEVMAAFSIDQSLAQWLSTGYLAASTVTMLATAWMIQSLGVRTTFLWASLLFIVSSLLGALSPNISAMILARVVQGACSGIFLPLAMVTLSQLFPPHRQGVAMGIFGLGAVLAPAFGPSLAGVLIDHYSWQAAFYLSLPLSVCSLPLAIRYLPQREHSGPPPRFDWLGALLLSLCVTATLVALSNGQFMGWQSAFILGCFLLALFSGLSFLWYQIQIEEPLLQLRVFRYRAFWLASVINLLFGAGIYSSTYLIPLLLQTTQGVSATDAGLLLLPAGILMGLTFPIAGYLSDRLDPRILLCSGMFLFAYSCYLMIFIDADTPFLALAFWLIVGRVGLGMIMPAVSVSALTPLPNKLLAQGSGTSNFLRQLGGAFGVNLISVYLNSQTGYYSSLITNGQPAVNAQTLEWFSWITVMTPNSTAGALTQQSTDTTTSSVIYQHASSLGFIDCFMMVALLSLLTLVPAFGLPALKRGKNHPQMEWTKEE